MLKLYVNREVPARDVEIGASISTENGRLTVDGVSRSKDEVVITGIREGNSKASHLRLPADAVVTVLPSPDVELEVLSAFESQAVEWKRVEWMGHVAIVSTGQAADDPWRLTIVGPPMPKPSTGKPQGATGRDDTGSLTVPPAG